MLQIVPKWKVAVMFLNEPDTVFWIYEAHIGNVLQKVAVMQFTENGLEEPQSIIISAAK